MGRAIIKVDKDEDLYMVFTTMVDSITMIGTREELAREGVTPGEFERADKFGSSSYRDRGVWDAAPLPMLAETRNEGWRFLLDRENYGTYARLMLEDRDTEAEALLRPDEDWQEQG